MPITRALALLPLVSLAFVASGCSKEAASISVEPKTARLTNEVRSVQLTATPRDSAGKAMKLPVTFSSMTPTIITTSADGAPMALLAARTGRRLYGPDLLDRPEDAARHKEREDKFLATTRFVPEPNDSAAQEADPDAGNPPDTSP